MARRELKVYEKAVSPYSLLLESTRDPDNVLMFESAAVAQLNGAEGELVKKTYKKTHDAFGCLGVLQIRDGEGSLLYLILVTGCTSVGKVGLSEVFRINAVVTLPLHGPKESGALSLVADERAQGIQKLFNSGTFYFSWSLGEGASECIDLTLCAQRKLRDHETDNRFFWNRTLYHHMERYGVPCSSWLVKVICGGVEIRTVYSGNKQLKACLISRLSCQRAGTRFNVRGCNDAGHAANFVETEQVIFMDEAVSSFVQVRGSIPLFWEQPGLNVGSHKIKMPRGYEASAPAFDRHFSTLGKQYGSLAVINLLGKKEGENMISQMFQNHHKASNACSDVPHVLFDYHSECKNNNKNLEKIGSKLAKEMETFGSFYFDGSDTQSQQLGVIRTNCIDCLDRTNAVQSFLGQRALQGQLERLGLAEKGVMVSRFSDIFKTVWPLNGDHISRIYAGTTALFGGKSKVHNVATSASRTIQGTFLDSAKQEAFSALLLGSSIRQETAERAHSLNIPNYSHANPALVRELVYRHPEYTDVVKTRVACATWNVNGGTHFRSIAFRNDSLSDWLLDCPFNTAETNPGALFQEDADFNEAVDIFAVGFEEIVDLTAKNITSASTSNQKAWSSELQKTLCRDHKYILLTSSQLVGVCLFVFVRPKLAPYIRDLAVDSVKTGLGGAAGNKGAVAIRFLLHSSTLCFVCSHFAAGQSNCSERNADFAEITKKLSFPMGQNLGSHEYIFWMGDLNYRIDLPKQEAEDLIERKAWSPLHAADQLLAELEKETTFQGYQEGPIRFAPTYKYDAFCDDYDTSEKARVPSWTDRILWKRNRLPGTEHNSAWSSGDLLLYNRAELKTSDHRPVLALLDIDVLRPNGKKYLAIQSQVISRHGPSDCLVYVSPADPAADELNDSQTEELLDLVGTVAEVVIVRFVDAEVILTLRTGAQALQTLQFNGHKLTGCEIRVQLKTPDWKERVGKELCGGEGEEVVSYIESTTNSLLGEDFQLPEMNFDGEEDLLDILDLPVPEGETTPVSLSGRSSPAVKDSDLLSSMDSSDSVVAPPSSKLLLAQPAGGSPVKAPPPARPSKPPSRPPPPTGRGRPAPTANGVQIKEPSGVQIKAPSGVPITAPSGGGGGGGNEGGNTNLAVDPIRSGITSVPSADDLLGGGGESSVLATPVLLPPTLSQPTKPTPLKPQPLAPMRPNPATLPAAAATVPSAGPPPVPPTARIASSNEVPVRSRPVSTVTANRSSFITKPREVHHQGAKSEEEAKELILKLMSQASVDRPDQPTPLLPSAVVPTAATTVLSQQGKPVISAPAIPGRKNAPAVSSGGGAEASGQESSGQSVEDSANGIISAGPNPKSIGNKATPPKGETVPPVVRKPTFGLLPSLAPQSPPEKDQLGGTPIGNSTFYIDLNPSSSDSHTAKGPTPDNQFPAKSSTSDNQFPAKSPQHVSTTDSKTTSSPTSKNPVQTTSVKSENRLSVKQAKSKNLGKPMGPPPVIPNRVNIGDKPRSASNPTDPSLCPPHGDPPNSDKVPVCEVQDTALGSDSRQASDQSGRIPTNEKSNPVGSAIKVGGPALRPAPPIPKRKGGQIPVKPSVAPPPSATLRPTPLGENSEEPPDTRPSRPGTLPVATTRSVKQQGPTGMKPARPSQTPPPVALAPPPVASPRRNSVKTDTKPPLNSSPSPPPIAVEPKSAQEQGTVEMKPSRPLSPPVTKTTGATDTELSESQTEPKAAERKPTRPMSPPSSKSSSRQESPGGEEKPARPLSLPGAGTTASDSRSDAPRVGSGQPTDAPIASRRRSTVLKADENTHVVSISLSPDEPKEQPAAARRQPSKASEDSTSPALKSEVGPSLGDVAVSNSRSEFKERSLSPVVASQTLSSSSSSVSSSSSQCHTIAPSDGDKPLSSNGISDGKAKPPRPAPSRPTIPKQVANKNNPAEQSSSPTANMNLLTSNPDHKHVAGVDDVDGIVVTNGSVEQPLLSPTTKGSGLAGKDGAVQNRTGLPPPIPSRKNQP